MRIQRRLEGRAVKSAYIYIYIYVYRPFLTEHVQLNMYMYVNIYTLVFQYIHMYCQLLAVQLFKI